MKDNSNRAEYLNILMAVLDAGLATGGAIAGTVPTLRKSSVGSCWICNR